ncbi:DUF5677 domain-containing protein [Actibacterium sp. XHP0104]|uniref:DUF5677 domain-containing protein n=1 Tax=Actibacterium sp. XHP0104 TaxID=2984335 RepID=UPI0021E8154A|nr:DUF5677 domain-containing protein [Actibacterium sp. XHP0104]MCV2880929.1 DUF5677 domain-containing protein [Actibacterium sp. XHP0104]
MGIIEDEFLKTIEKEIEEALERHTELIPDDLDKVTEETIQSSLSELIDVFPDALERSSTKIVQRGRRDQLGFEKRCYRRWRGAFELYDIILGVATEVGEKHAQEHFEESQVGPDYIFGALTFLHPRMLLVASEIGALLRAGFPDGALARWRTLHEISVVAMFISQNDQDTAKRYLASFQFNDHRAALQVNEYADRANLTPFSPEEIAEMRAVCSAIEGDLGRAIGKDYDWAKEALDTKHVTLFDLEKATGLDHWRPRYRWASQHTHAGHRPLDRLLGMVEAKRPVNLVGSSNSGFVDPLSMAGISIAICCTAFFGTKPTMDSVVAMKSVEVLGDRLGQVALRLEAETLEPHEQRRAIFGLPKRLLDWLGALVSRGFS